MAPADYTVSSYLLDRLKELGIEHVMGVPGDYGFTFMDTIEGDPDISWVGCCNELNAGYAADAYARTRGIAAATGSVGVFDLGAAAAVAGAYCDYVPLIFISCYPGTEDMKRGIHTHHSLQGEFTHFAGMFKHMTTLQTVLTVDNSCEEIDRALLSCLTKKLPVYIGFPSDVQELHAQPPQVKLSVPAVTSDALQLDAFIKNITSILTSAKKAVMLIDYPVLSYGLIELVRDLAAKTGIPFAAPPLASAFLGEKHPMYLGTYSGGAGTPVDNQVESADVLIRICIQHDERNAGYAAINFEGKNVVNLKPDNASIAGANYPQVVLRDILLRLIKELPERKLTDNDEKLIDDARPFKATPKTSITQDRLWEAFSNFVKEDDVLVIDWGTCQVLTMLSLPVTTRRVMHGSWSAIGYSLPALLGANLGDPSKRHIHITGDGAFQETAQELSTIIHEGLAPITILLNNNRYLVEDLTHIPPMQKRYNKVPLWDYHKLPSVLGGEGKSLSLQITTEEELVTGFAAAENARLEGRYVLLEVMLGPADVPNIMIKATDAQAEAIKKRNS